MTLLGLEHRRLPLRDARGGGGHPLHRPGPVLQEEGPLRDHRQRGGDRLAGAGQEAA